MTKKILTYKTEHVPCNICGNNNPETIFTKAQADNILGRYGELNYVKCPKCHLVYINPRPIEKDIQALYSLQADTLSYGYIQKEQIEKDFSPLMQKKRQQYMQILEKFKKTGRFLDVGCANGALLKTAQEKGWRSYGVELTPQCVEYVKNLGFEVSEGEIFKAAYPDNFFDTITLTEVIDHMADPAKTLIECHRVLRPGGAVLITVQNFHSLIIRLLGPKWPLIGLHHLYYFTSVTIDKLLQKTGFKVEKINFTGLNPFKILKTARRRPSSFENSEKDKSFPSPGKWHLHLLKPFVQTFAQITKLGNQMIITAVKE